MEASVWQHPDLLRAGGNLPAGLSLGDWPLILRILFQSSWRSPTSCQEAEQEQNRWCPGNRGDAKRTIQPQVQNKIQNWQGNAVVSYKILSLDGGGTGRSSR